MAEDDKTTEAKLGLKDTIAKNRTLPVVDPASVPFPPPGFVPTASGVLKVELRRIAGSSEAEAEKSLEQIVARGASVPTDLGEDAPLVSRAAELLTRRQTISATKSRLIFALQYINEIEDINNSDIQEILEEFGKEYAHKRQKHPELRQFYNKLEEYLAIHGQSIKEAMAEKKKKATLKSEENK